MCVHEYCGVHQFVNILLAVNIVKQKPAADFRSAAGKYSHARFVL